MIVATFWDYLRPWVWTAETWAGLQFGVLAAAAFVGWRQLGEARRLREGSLRPFVVVDFDVDENIEVYLSVANIGATMARDVRITFDHPFETAVLQGGPNERRYIDQFVERLEKGIPILPPGKKMRTLFDLTNHRAEQGGDLRDEYTATITYRSEVTGKSYNDTYVVDLGVNTGRMWVNKKGVHQIAELAEKIERSLASLARSGIRVTNLPDEA